MRLPADHLARPRLVAACEGAAVVLIEAGAGWGKSVLTAQLAAAAAAGGGAGRVVAVGLRPDPQRWIGRLCDQLDAEVLDPQFPVEALLAALTASAEPTLLVVDDAHAATPGDAALLAKLAFDLPAPHRLVIATRLIGGLLAAMREHPSLAEIGATDLAMTSGEIAALASARGLAARHVDRVVAALGGWPAGVRRALDHVQQPSQSDAADSLHLVVDATLARAGPELAAGVRTLAALPPLDAATAAAVTGVKDVLTRAVLADVPFYRDGGGWSLPPAFRRRAAVASALDAAAAQRASSALLASGRPADAVRAHLAADDSEGAAEVLDGLSGALLERLAPEDAATLVDALPAPVRSRHPLALLAAAKALRRLGEHDRAGVVLDEAEAAVAADRSAAMPVAVLRFDVEVQQACDDEALWHRGQELLADAWEAPAHVRAQLDAVVGFVAVRTGRLDEAARLLARAAAVDEAVGRPAAAARSVTHLASLVERLQPSPRVALPGPGARACPDDPAVRGAVCSLRVDLHLALGDLEGASADLEEARRIGAASGDRFTGFFAAWGAALLNAARADLGGVIASVRDAERRAGAYALDGENGVDFLGEVAEALDRVGAHDEADARLMLAAAAAAYPWPTARFAEGAVAARRGDPITAGAVLTEYEGHPEVPVTQRIRSRLLRGLAALRRGDVVTATALAAEAFEEAAALNAPQLLSLHEPQAVRRLAHLAAGAGSEAARRAAPAQQDPPLFEVRVLGGLVVSADGATVAVPPGRPTRLVGLLACEGGRVPVPRVLDVLWPEEPEQMSRPRLREVLHRLRRAAPLVVREGETLCFVEGIRLDLAEAERAVALAVGRGPGRDLEQVASALTAEPLPGEYDDHAEEARRRASGARLAALDLWRTRLWPEAARRGGALVDGGGPCGPGRRVAPCQSHAHPAGRRPRTRRTARARRWTGRARRPRPAPVSRRPATGGPGHPSGPPAVKRACDDAGGAKAASADSG